MKSFRADWLVLPLIGAVAVVALWFISSHTWAKDLPDPVKTWQSSKDYVLKPFEKRGEMDQGILRFTWYSLILVTKGYIIALLLGIPLGFMLGLSKMSRLVSRYSTPRSSQPLPNTPFLTSANGLQMRLPKT